MVKKYNYTLLIGSLLCMSFAVYSSEAENSSGSSTAQNSLLKSFDKKDPVVQSPRDAGTPKIVIGISSIIVLAGAAAIYYLQIHKPANEKKCRELHECAQRERKDAENKKCADLLKDITGSIGLELAGRADKRTMIDNAAALFGNKDCKHLCYNNHLKEYVTALARLDRTLLNAQNSTTADITLQNLTKIIKAHNSLLESELAADREMSRRLKQESLVLKSQLEQQRKVSDLTDQVAGLARQVGTVTREHIENRAWHDRQYRGLESALHLMATDIGQQSQGLQDSFSRVSTMVERLMHQEPLQEPLPTAPGGPMLEAAAA